MDPLNLLEGKTCQSKTIFGKSGKMITAFYRDRIPPTRKFTLPKTNIAPEDSSSQEETGTPVFQTSIFRCELLVWGIVDVIWKETISKGNFVFQPVIFRRYCWWKKSCTTKDDEYPIMNRVLTIPGGAGFLPSTVCSFSAKVNGTHFRGGIKLHTKMLW